MNVWLLKIGEPVPVDAACKERLHRTGLLAGYLAEEGHEVTWWTSTFDRVRRVNLFDHDVEISRGERSRIVMLHGPGYGNSISFSRIRDQRTIAEKFLKKAMDRPPPDVILSAYPTVELCKSAVNYGRNRGVPIILDMRDMWPDIFLESVPKFLRPAARLILYPMFRDSQDVCSRATAITGITEEFVEWGLSRGNRERTALDRSFPMAYTTKPPPKNEIQEAERYWDTLGIIEPKTEFIACFVGTIGHQFDLETPILASRMLNQSGRKVRFVFCGTGDRLDFYKKMASGDESVLFPGWVDAAKMYVLLRRSTIGLNPIPNRYDFLSTINNKAIEYMSAGLPMLSCPKNGVLYRLLEAEECGSGYDAGDPSSLSQAIIRFYDAPDLLRSWSENAKRVHERRFDAEFVYRDMVRYLAGIADGYCNKKGTAVSGPCSI